MVFLRKRGGSGEDAERRDRTAGKSVERGVTGGAMVLVSGGLALSVLFAFGTTTKTWHRVLGASFALFAAACLIGAFAGFLFGLPQNAPAVAGEQRSGRFLFNSNLLKVSDWLTTIIVGLTLVNLKEVGPTIGDLAAVIGPPLGANTQSKAFGLGLVIAGFSGSAILMYLWTAVRLRQHLERSEQEIEAAYDKRGAEVAKDFLSGRTDEATLARAVGMMTAAGLENLEATARAAVTQPDDKSSRLLKIVEEAKNPPGEDQPNAS